MRVASVTVLGTPAGKGSWRCIGSKGRHQLIPDNRAALKGWTALLRGAVLDLLAAGHGPYAGPVCVEVTFTIPRPDSVPLAKRAWPHTRGVDLDKALRALLDALQPDLIADDSQVVQIVAAKTYPDTPDCADRLDQPGAVIRIWKVTP